MNYVNEDCFSFIKEIPERSIDLVLIDPPYEISSPTNFQAGEKRNNDIDRSSIPMDFGDWDKNFYGLQEIIKECYRILRDGGSMICFYDIWKIETLKKYYENANFKQIRFIEWIKTNPVSINSKINYLSNAREIAIYAVKKSKPVFNSCYDRGIYEFPICNDKGRFHPTQKPLKLIKSLIKKHSNKGDTVFDCFSGSCTTGVAALQLNRQFIGCEISPKYYKESLERLKENGFI